MSREPVGVSIAVPADVEVVAMPFDNGAQIYLRLGSVGVNVFDAQAEQLVAAVEQARREAAAMRGER